MKITTLDQTIKYLQENIVDQNKLLEVLDVIVRQYDEIHRLQNSIAAVRAANDAWKTIVTELREEIKQLKTVWQ